MSHPHIAFSGLGPCSRCKRGADWNTPTAPANNINGPLLCDTCTDNTLEFRRGLKQHLRHGQRQWDLSPSNYSYGNVNVHVAPAPLGGAIESAWYENGTWAIPHAAIRYLFSNTDTSLEDQLKHLYAIWRRGIAFCTSCARPHKHTDLRYTQFAGRACPACYVKFQDEIANQRKRGFICSMCRQPYAQCSC